MLATLMTLVNSFWTKYDSFGQSSCCQEGYEYGGTIADKSRLVPAFFLLLLSRLLSNDERVATDDTCNPHDFTK